MNTEAVWEINILQIKHEKENKMTLNQNIIILGWSKYTMSANALVLWGYRISTSSVLCNIVTRMNIQYMTTICFEGKERGFCVKNQFKSM